VRRNWGFVPACRPCLPTGRQARKPLLNTQVSAAVHVESFVNQTVKAGFINTLAGILWMRIKTPPKISCSPEHMVSMPYSRFYKIVWKRQLLNEETGETEEVWTGGYVFEHDEPK